MAKKLALPQAQRDDCLRSSNVSREQFDQSLGRSFHSFGKRSSIEEPRYALNSYKHRAASVIFATSPMSTLITDILMGSVASADGR